MTEYFDLILEVDHYKNFLHLEWWYERFQQPGALDELALVTGKEPGTLKAITTLGDLCFYRNCAAQHPSFRGHPMADPPQDPEEGGPSIADSNKDSTVATFDSSLEGCPKLEKMSRKRKRSRDLSTDKLSYKDLQKLLYTAASDDSLWERQDVLKELQERGFMGECVDTLPEDVADTNVGPAGYTVYEYFKMAQRAAAVSNFVLARSYFRLGVLPEAHWPPMQTYEAKRAKKIIKKFVGGKYSIPSHRKQHYKEAQGLMIMSAIVLFSGHLLYLCLFRDTTGGLDPEKDRKELAVFRKVIGYKLRTRAADEPVEIFEIGKRRGDEVELYPIKVLRMGFDPRWLNPHELSWSRLRTDVPDLVIAKIDKKIRLTWQLMFLAPGALELIEDEEKLELETLAITTTDRVFRKGPGQLLDFKTSRSGHCLVETSAPSRSGCSGGLCAVNLDEMALFSLGLDKVLPCAGLISWRRAYKGEKNRYTKVYITTVNRDWVDRYAKPLLSAYKLPEFPLLEKLKSSTS